MQNNIANDNEEILYQVTKRSPGYLIIGVILPSLLCTLFFPYLIFVLDKPSILSASIGTFLLFFGVNWLVEVITFKELTIYKNRVEIDRSLFGKAIIRIEDIKDAVGGGYLTSVSLDIFTYNRFKVYEVSSLYDKDSSQICRIIHNLKQEKQQ